MSGAYVLVSVMEFSDDTCSGMVLHRGTKDDCEAIAERIPAVSYSGDKQVVRSYLSVVTEEMYDAAIKEQP